VSALIHAATMVAAGVYLVGGSTRCSPPTAFLFIACFGLITLFLTARSPAQKHQEVAGVLDCCQLGT